MEIDMADAGASVSAVPPEAAGGLQSPPESNNTLHDGSDSDLSDLGEEPEEDIGIIEPDHIETGVPVFKPTMAQFKDFQLYMKKVNPYGMRSGIVKVVPPQEWLDKLPSLDDAIRTIRVKEPIKQDIVGTSGTYRQNNILHQRSYNLPQWRQLCEQSEHQPPAKRGETRSNRAPPKPRGQTAAKKRVTRGTAKNRAKVSDDASGQATPERLPTPVSPAIKPQEDNDSIKCEESDEDKSLPRPKGGRQPKATTVGARRKFNKREAGGKIDEEAFKNFQYKLEGEDFSPERCEELERVYWKTLTYAAPLYGADMPGTLFDDRTEAWNLGKLENLLDVLGTKIPGVNTAYLYLGMWKATFAWHLEDVDLYSINIVHFGAPKQWYSISQGDARRFEAAMKTIFAADAKACDQFLRHKTFLISPSNLLQNYNIRVNKVVAHPGEFVITFPYGYHSGYNLGYNCAEAVNFALDSWLEYGRIAKKCDCAQAQDSVWIDVREIERKLRGEETDYEETEDEEDEEDEDPTDLPTPPDSSGGDIKIKMSQKKRKRTITDKGGRSQVKKIRVRFNLPLKEPCILCPNDIPGEPLLPTDDGRKAHRICALYIPETSIEEGEQPTAVDIEYIDKNRMELKCNYCRSKRGACFQCSQKKCTRAYHATCAAAAGVLVEQGEIPVFGEDGTEYKEEAIEFSCRFHRSKRDKRLDGAALAKDPEINNAAALLAIGEVVQMQYLKEEIFAGTVVENNVDEGLLTLELLPGGDQREIAYQWLLLPDPADLHLPKPSANAIPMPKTRKEKLDLNTSKRTAHDQPRADDKFVDGYTYAEFRTAEPERNLAQVNIDFAKENQIWYYLGKTSTEAKAQFTEDVRKPRHNPKGHFLDTIPKATVTASRQSYAASYPTKVNYHALNAAKVNRPSPLQNSVQSTSRQEKPYIYKPRYGSDSYRVDPQAYRSQQDFLQQATPSWSISKPAGYSFGTDPRWKQPNQSSQSPYSSLVPAANRPASVSGQMMAPPAACSNPQAQAAKGNNPFSGKSSQGSSSFQKYASKPNPFAKYPYLQIEHNRSPMEYKTPYRPHGGFMNGYQGSLEKHLQQTMFGNRSSPANSSTSSLLSYGSGQQLHGTNQSSPLTSYSPIYQRPGSQDHSPSGMSSGSAQPAYEAYKAMIAQQKSGSQPTWGSKTNAQLHPALRSGIQSTSDQADAQMNYTNSQGSSSHSRVSGGKTALNSRPPQKDDDVRYAQETRQVLHAPQPRHSGPLAPPQAYVPPYQSGAMQKALSPPATNHYPYPYPTIQEAPIPALTPQPQILYQPSVLEPAQDVTDGLGNIAANQSYHQRKQSLQKPGEPSWIPPSLRFRDYVQQESQTNLAENKPVLAQQDLNSSSFRQRDFPDVPIDSTSLVEKMMLNLKKATGSNATA